MDYIKTVSGPIVNMADADMMPLTQCLVDINAVQSGSGTPSPTNARPISGFDTATIYVRGKNILNPTFTTKTENGVTFENVNKTVKITGTASAYSFCNLNYTNGVLAIPKGRPLKLAGGFSNSIYLTACYFKEGTSTTITAATSTSGEFVPFTIPEDASTSWIRVNVAAGATTDRTILPMVCADGTTDTAFKPYDARSFTKSTPLGRTVYGGTLDVVSGELTVDREMVDLGTLTWTYQSGTGLFYSNGYSSCKNNTTKLIFSDREWTPKSNQTEVRATDKSICKDSNGRFYVHDSSYTTTADFQSAMSGSMMCYELATPQTYTLTGQEVSAMYGENYIWGSSGDTTIEYTYLPYGLYGEIRLDGEFLPKPRNFMPGREDVYAGEYTTCTGKTIADRIGWKFSDLDLQWDALKQSDIDKLIALTDTCSLRFDDADGLHTEDVIRTSAVSLRNRNTIDGVTWWRDVSAQFKFINTHNE